MEDQVTPEKLNDYSEKPDVVADDVDRPHGEDVQTLRSELITLAEKCEIKHSVAYIKKAVRRRKKYGRGAHA